MINVDRHTLVMMLHHGGSRFGRRHDAGQVISAMTVVYRMMCGDMNFQLERRVLLYPSAQLDHDRNPTKCTPQKTIMPAK